MERQKMKTIDISLKNEVLYAGCNIEEVGGRANLVTPVTEAVNVVGRNVAKIVEETPREDRIEVLLTGPMAVWAYLVCFHAVLHAFSRVYYSDGRSEPVLVAAHG
jgi:hypothetical protein